MARKLSPEQENLDSPERERHHLVIGIHGGVGAGKTRLAELICERCGLTRFEESFRKNPYLERFYDDPANWSFQSQSFFIKDFYGQADSIPEDRPMLHDPAGSQHKEIYAWVQHFRMGWMDILEYPAYRLLCKELEKIQPIHNPDIIISVHAPIEIILRRIRRRAEEENREFELKMLRENPKYFEWIAHRVEQWAKENHNNLPIIVVDSHEFNYVDNPFDAYQIVSHIQDKVDTYLGGREDIILPSSFRPGPMMDPRVGKISKMDNRFRRRI